MLRHIQSLTSSILLLSLIRPVYSANGFVGYGISMYKPPCAHACRSSIANPLNCSTNTNDGMGIAWNIEESPEPECYATNDAFLQTLAYCIYSHCRTESNSTLQRYWETNVAGSEKDQPLPKQAYQQALQSIGFRPNITANASTTLESASLVSEELYELNWRTLTIFEKVEATHEKYGLVLLLTGAIIPIGLSFARFIPVPTRLKTSFEAYVITPPLIGHRHQAPLFNTFNMPTRGQALFIAYLIIINVVLCAVGFTSADPSAWYTSNRVEILTYVSNRAGILSFANIPLLVLYSSRNNILLWLTNWSHSTFLLLHRWIAAICVIEACLHSAIYLQIYSAKDEHASESQCAYWYWGIVATLAMVVIVPGSMLQVRRQFYEFFLAWHVIFFLLAMVGCCLHIYYRYNFQWGYENWIYIALAVWGFERGMRILRFARHGICTAQVSIVDDEYIKLEIPGVAAEGDVYLYFPTLTWRVWENHPFSVMTDVSCGSDTGSSAIRITTDKGRLPISWSEKGEDLDKISLSEISNTPCQRGLVFYIRTQSGITKYLRGTKSKFPVLVESSYHPVALSKPNASDMTNIIAIAGGVGVTALAPILMRHEGWHRLFWAVRSKPLADSVAASLGADRFDRLNSVTFLNSRMDISRILQEEVSRCAGTEVAVIVSGPARMADERSLLVGSSKIMKVYIETHV
ncbi:ferric reductase like transmembrane component-domain-containing protein [Aspergillus transmontanensis]|uniref:Ferric reductase like transmembrane component-domain-containing protein n=1 Tax=Aspergillus transmontanensis TaxID=1034304 RepID=A0A5N6W4V4_9EURO|nr:ferric reductase like transmembrane component-domain-containing protein [Aspergillus transmontanensis]